MGGTCGTNGGEENDFGGRNLKKGQLDRYRRRWEDNIKMYVNKCYSRECIGLMWFGIWKGGGSLFMLVGSCVVSLLVSTWLVYVLRSRNDE